ncbi:hypothetical protein B0O99DRAFT_629588 [Bisporella sp. PMI_857]|nr:hypothetical protein B0O99DRAFT_629588 [Bisporella sp. PMI_857]
MMFHGHLYPQTHVTPRPDKLHIRKPSKMGGSAFASLPTPLHTPRMPLNVYEQITKDTQAVLQNHAYRHVGSPIEAPEKETFGDVDILVYEPLDPLFDSTYSTTTTIAEKVGKLLKAEKWIVGKPTINFAVPYPGEENNYVQLDLHICRSKSDYDWELFHSAHGDLWNIIVSGSTIRTFGITVNNNGMYLRIPEIEAFNRKKSMILLATESRKILEFLGLDHEKWWKPFSSRQEMFEYAAGCRMFWVKETKAEDEAEGDVIVEGNFAGQEGGESGKKKLKHNDRARMRKRPIFREWIDEFIPKCRQEGRLGNTNTTREDVRNEAFATFGVKQEYETRVREWQLLRHKEYIWKNIIKNSIPEDTNPVVRGAATRTLKLVILEGGAFDGEVPRAVEKDENGFHNLEEVKKFVADNWKRAGQIGLERQHLNMIGQTKAKEEKKAAERMAEEKMDAK